jgi:hypothetical protein
MRTTMRDLNDLDPLPKLPRGFRMMYKDNEWYSLPASRRHEGEMAKKRDKLFGEDWQPYKRDGQIVPHTYINGQGKLKTEGYQPPEPPETDIPIPCVVDSSDDALDAMVYMLRVLGYNAKGHRWNQRIGIKSRSQSK